MPKFTFNVPEISCDHCKTTIEGELSEVEGVEGVVVDIEAKRVAVGGDPSREAVVAAISKAGYEVAD